MKVSVIIPFYKVAPFIRRCAVSLLEQTLGEVEFIFVDDASPDESRAILEEEIRNHPDRNARILTHEVNKGLPAARNTGLAAATGDFIYHCDSDDWVEKDMLEKMYEAAGSTGADFIYCDFFLNFGEKERYMVTPDYTEPDRMIKEGFLAGLMKYNVWNKMARRELYLSSGIRFPDGHGMGEDMTMILLGTKARKVTAVHQALYHYVKLNSNAFSNTFSQRHLDDILFNTKRTLNGLEDWETEEKDLYLNLFKLNVKLPLLLSGDRAQYGIWKEWFPESDPYIMKNKHLPFRTRLVQWFAAHGLFPAVDLYRFLVDKVFYKLLYR